MTDNHTVSEASAQKSGGQMAPMNHRRNSRLLSEIGLGGERMTSESIGYHKLAELAGYIDELSQRQYDDHELEQWRLSVGAVLETRFPRGHDIHSAWTHLRFRYSTGRIRAAWDPPISSDQHNASMRQDMEKARGVINSALEVWSLMASPELKGRAERRGPLVEVHNTNSAAAVANSAATATANVDFPLADLLALVDQSPALSPDQKEQAKEQLEDLDGELRKTNPRWEKVKPALKFMLDTGKEVAIKTIGAVAAQMLTGK